MRIRHEQCPRCATRGDDTRRDNLARYPDGGAFCFACHYYESPTKFRPKEVETASEDLERLRVLLSEKQPLPEENRAWLKQYLTDDEIDNFFFYDPRSRRHVYAFIGSNGLEFWEKRSVNGGIPKVVSGGTKPFVLYGKWLTTNTVVLVEDVVSALKVSRQFGAFPLFGSHLKLEHAIKLANIRKIKNYVVWLDFDKYEEALDTAALLESIISPDGNVAVVLSEKDPKANTDEEILEKVSQYVLK